MSKYIITITERAEESVCAETILVTASSMKMIAKNLSHILLTNIQDINTCRTITVCVETLEKTEAL